MAKTSHKLVALLFFLNFSQAATANTTTIANKTSTTPKKGFSMKLVHSDSVKNPDLFANLTISQRILRQIEFSKSHIHSLKSRMKIPGYNTTLIRPPLFEKQRIYMVVVSIGTQLGEGSYYLEIDTGSSLTWTQCVPCNPSFPQRQPMFNPKLSPTYRRISGNDPMCVHPFWNEHGLCSYTIEYLDNTHVTGFVSTETFTFVSTNGSPHYESIPNVVFGCAYSTHMNFQDIPAGIMGMDCSDHSMALQLAHLTNGRFSYCLFPPSAAYVGFLRFGDDIVMHEPVSRTPLTGSRGSGTYFSFKLTDISIEGSQMRFQQGIFEVTFIDSGATFSRLVRRAYNGVREVLVAYFKHFDVQPVDGRRQYRLPFDLCYTLPQGSESILPSMTWHLRGADLHIGAMEVFMMHEVRGRRIFCLAILPDDDVTVLGVHQQYNKRFTFDLLHQQMLFSDEDCSQDID